MLQSKHLGSDGGIKKVPYKEASMKIKKRLFELVSHNQSSAFYRNERTNEWRNEWDRNDSIKFTFLSKKEEEEGDGFFYIRKLQNTETRGAWQTWLISSFFTPSRRWCYKIYCWRKSRSPQNLEIEKCLFWCLTTPLLKCENNALFMQNKTVKL